MAITKAKKGRLVKPSTGHPPAILSKGSSHKVKTKYVRKKKHYNNLTEKNV
jgi:hypothetical protein|tara:strand:- start:176 stop:328 length:153 start_codon:yes stop_codon:yes gene_type:complete